MANEEEQVAFLDTGRTTHDRPRRVASIVSIACMNSLLICLQKYVLDTNLTTPSIIILQSEIIKLTVGLVFSKSPWGLMTRSTAIAILPAICYQTSTLTLMQALTKLPAPIYQPLLQTKIVWTMLMSFLIMRRVFSMREIAHNIQVVLCAVLFVHQVTPRGNQTHSGIWKMAMLVFAGTGFSSTASVVSEKLLKSDVSLWLRNAQFALGAIIIQIIYCFAFKIPVDFSHGSSLVYVTSCFDAMYGVCISMFLKQFDSIYRNMCLILSTCITFAANCILSGGTIDLFDVIALFANIFAVGLVIS